MLLPKVLGMLPVKGGGYTFRGEGSMAGKALIRGGSFISVTPESLRGAAVGSWGKRVRLIEAGFRVCRPLFLPLPEVD